MIKLRLVLDVDYEPGSTSKEELEAMLKDIPNYAAGVGLMSGETDAEVDSWHARVEDSE